jgi:hypothetical protein
MPSTPNVMSASKDEGKLDLNLDLEKISNFPIEKSNDGKIIPPP